MTSTTRLVFVLSFLGLAIPISLLNAQELGPQVNENLPPIEKHAIWSEGTVDLDRYPERRFPQELVDRVSDVFTPSDSSKKAYQTIRPALDYSIQTLESKSPEWSALPPETKIQIIKRRQRTRKMIDYILALPEEKTDIWKISLTLAKDAYPELDIEAYGERFEQFAAEAGKRMPLNGDPEQRIRALNTFLYQEVGIGFDKSDYHGRKPINHHLFGVLATHRGACSNLAIFYVALAQRLGFPVYAVIAPNHVFARYVDPRLKEQNIEPTSGGGFIPDEDYAIDVSEEMRERGRYLKTLTYKELAAEMILGHAADLYATEKHDWAGAADFMHRALDQKDSRGYFILGQIYGRWGRRLKDPKLREILYTKAVFLQLKGRWMGFEDPLPEDYWKMPAKRAVSAKLPEGMPGI